MSAAALDDWEAGFAPPPSPGGRPAKSHAGRMRKVECSPCGVILYGSTKALTTSGLPVCGCGQEMVLPNLRDRAAVERDTLEAELMAAGRQAFNDAARELGWERWTDNPDAEARRAQQEQEHGFTTRACNCAVCGRFKPRPADRCEYCGDEPAVYGGTDGERREAERIHNRGQGYAS